VFYGIAFEVAALLFNAVWDCARAQQLMRATIDPGGAIAIRRRFRLALGWIASGTLLGALLPVIGVSVIAAFIPFYWRPIPGEISSRQPVDEPVEDVSVHRTEVGYSSSATTARAC
jgi:hypothetical protein